MKNQLLPLLSLICLFAFASCEQESIDTPHSIQPQVVSSLSDIEELVVYHVSELNMETGDRSGFIVDRHGSLKTYSLTAEEADQLPSIGEWTENEMQYLHHKANEQHLNIEETTLLDHYNLNRAAVSASLSEKLEDQDQHLLHTIHAFKARTVAENNGNCNNGNCGDDNSIMITTYYPYLLKSAGAYQQVRNHEKANELVIWLEDLKLEAGL